jgi:sulfur carrier protein ThiS adenylyltransferase
MATESARILAVTDAASREHYPATLFAAEQACQGSCTARSTIYAANIAAGWMVAMFTRWLRKLQPESDIYVNLLGTQLWVMV